MTRPGKGVVEISGDSKARHDRSKLNRSEINDDEVDGGEVDDEVGKKSQNISKSKKSSKSKKMVESLDIFTPRARLAITKLR